MAEDGRVSIFVGRRGARTSTPEEWRALILDERLRRTDTVAVRRDGETKWMPAGDVPELRPLFDEVVVAHPIGPPPEPSPRRDADAPAPPDPEDGFILPPGVGDGDEQTRAENQRALREVLAQPGFASDGIVPITPETPKRSLPPLPQERRRGLGCATWFWIGLLVFGAAVFLGIRSCSSTPPDPAAENAAAIASAEPVDRFVTRLSRVRAAPTAASAPPVGELRRGASVTGILTADPNNRSIVWMRLTRGRWEGRYVWAANLDTTPPPRLRGGPMGLRTAAARGEIHVRPDVGAERLGTLSPGDRIRVAGDVGGGWLEMLRPSGGVAYVRESVLQPMNGPPIAEDEATAPSEEQPE